MPSCPFCGNEVREGARFCPGCGANLGSTAMNLAQSQKPGATTPPPAAAAPRPAAPPPAAATPPPTAAMAAAPPSPTPYASPPQPVVTAAPAVAAIGATGQGTSIWGPFAGFGYRREHQAWLLRDLAPRAEKLRDTIAEQFERRQIPNATVSQVNLTGKGVAVEQRPFYRIQRGLATVWLYVARAGQDLYVSQVSYIKGPISLARILFAVGLAAVVFINIINVLAASINLSAVAESYSSSGLFGLGGGPTVEPSGFLLSMLCCTTPLAAIAQLVLLVGVVFSAYKFLTDRDVLALLRSSPTEFQEDDIVSLEKAVNETVRQSADLVGIDLKLLEPGRAYRETRRRLL